MSWCKISLTPSATPLRRNGHAAAFTTQINDFLTRQATRMEQAILVARQQKELEASRKRQAISDQLESSAKRRRIDSGAGVDAMQVFAAPNNPLATFDASGLPLPLVVDLVVANLEGLSEVAFTDAIEVRLCAHPRFYAQ